MCLSVCVCGFAQQIHVVPRERVAPQGPSDPGQKLIVLKNNKTKTDEKERINQVWRKTKATGQRGPKCRLACTWSKKEGGKRKASLERKVGESSFFSGTAESLIMGLDLTSAPLGMWKRGLVVNGWKSFSGMMWVGWNRGGVLLVVLDGSGRQHAGGLGQMPRVGGNRSTGVHMDLCQHCNCFHSEQLAHNGYSGPRSPSGRTWRSQVVPARVPRYNKDASIHLAGGRMSRFCKTTSKTKNVPGVEQGLILSKQSVGWFSQSERFPL